MITTALILAALALFAISVVVATGLGRWLRRAGAIAIALVVCVAFFGSVQILLPSLLPIGVAALVLGSGTFWRIVLWSLKSLVAKRMVKEEIATDARRTIREPISSPQIAPLSPRRDVAARTAASPKQSSPWVE